LNNVFIEYSIKSELKCLMKLGHILYMRLISYRIGYQGETKINSVEVHPQLNNNRHLVDGALVGVAGSLWPISSSQQAKFTYMIQAIDISD
jgi:hypothetical protein